MGEACDHFDPQQLTVAFAAVVGDDDGLSVEPIGATIVGGTAAGVAELSPHAMADAVAATSRAHDVSNYSRWR